LTKERQHTVGTGEEIVFYFLKEQGYNIIERNYRFRFGEIDIVAEHREYLIFFEVKSHKNRTGLHQSLSVTAKNLRNLECWVNIISVKSTSCNYNPESM